VQMTVYEGSQWDTASACVHVSVWAEQTSRAGVRSQGGGSSTDYLIV
jgi:hypothetical protein